MKIWRLPEDGLIDAVCNPESTVVQKDKRVENVTWNPVAENVLALSIQQAISIYDVEHQEARIGMSKIQHYILHWNISCLSVLENLVMCSFGL